jgi:hypothetical protein
MSPELRSDVLAFYHDRSNAATDSGDWERVLKELDQLQSVDADLGHGQN